MHGGAFGARREDEIPGGNVIHQFPDRMRGFYRMGRGLLRGNAVEQFFQVRAVPGFAVEGAVHLIDDAIYFGHESPGGIWNER